MTLDDLVRDLCDSLGDSEARLFYTRILRLSIHAIDSLHLRVISNFRSTKAVVKSNLTTDLPSDCIKVAKVAKYLEIDGVPCTYPLGRTDDNFQVAGELIIRNPQNLSCDQTPPSTDQCLLGDELIYWPGSSLGTYYLGTYYGEEYGQKTSRFFGLYYDDRENNRLIFPAGYCIQEDDWVVFTYKSTNEDAKFSLITIDMYPMLRHRVLSWFWENQDRGKSMDHFQKFRMEVKEYQKSKTSRSYEDIIDAITSGYQYAAR